MDCEPHVHMDTRTRPSVGHYLPRPSSFGLRSGLSRPVKPYVWEWPVLSAQHSAAVNDPCRGSAENREEHHRFLTILKVREHGREAGANGVFQTLAKKGYRTKSFIDFREKLLQSRQTILTHLFTPYCRAELILSRSAR